MGIDEVLKIMFFALNIYVANIKISINVDSNNTIKHCGYDK
jgi:hypothetical protein